MAPKQRLIGGALVVAAALAATLAVLLQHDTRVELFAAPLQSEQVAEVAERLAEWNVGFVAQPDNVRVDAARRDELLLRLALAGVPHPHLATSAETLEKAGPLVPQSVLEAQERAGLAGDLASALRGLPGISDAEIIIAPAHEATFADDPAHAATASVRLSVAPGEKLGRSELDGVRQFVAAGVPGLDPSHVAILDDRGTTFDDPSGSGADEASDLEQSLQSALDAAFGAGAAIVRVRVSYDPRLRQSHDVVRTPLGSSAIVSQTTAEHYKSPSKQYAKTSAALDRGSEVRDERTDTPANRIERISVAVAVDAARGLDLAKIRSLAAATLGLDPSRGDVVSVEDVAFAHAAPAPAYPFATVLGFLMALAPSLVVALAIVAGARVGAKPLAALGEAVVHRLALRRASRTALAQFAPAQVRGALRNEPPHTAAAIISALPAATATAVLDLYPPEERAAIVRRLARAASPAVPDYESVLRRA